MEGLEQFLDLKVTFIFENTGSEYVRWRRILSPSQCLSGMAPRRVTAQCGNGEELEGTSLAKRSNGDRTLYRSFHLNKQTTTYKNPNSGSVVKMP